MSRLNYKKGGLQEFPNTPGLPVAFGGDNAGPLHGNSLTRHLQHFGFSCGEPTNMTLTQAACNMPY